MAENCMHVAFLSANPMPLENLPFLLPTFASKNRIAHGAKSARRGLITTSMNVSGFSRSDFGILLYYERMWMILKRIGRKDK